VRSLSSAPLQDHPSRLRQLGTRSVRRTKTHVKQEGKGPYIARTPRALASTQRRDTLTARPLRGDA
jgi:hypothetical protein